MTDWKPEEWAKFKQALDDGCVGTPGADSSSYHYPVLAPNNPWHFCRAGAGWMDLTVDDALTLIDDAPHHFADELRDMPASWAAATLLATAAVILFGFKLARRVRA
jgi:hypothetical protein